MLEKQINLRNIHLIRGFAAVLVVIFHSKFILWSGGTDYINKIGLHSAFDYFLFSLDMLSSCGRQAVLIFFLLSAVVISHSFRKNPSLLLFAKIRTIRIYIPYLLSMLISVGVLILCGKYLIDPSYATREYTSRLFVALQDINLKSFFKALIFIPNEEFFGYNFVYWSLLHEAIFYILFPLYNKFSSKILIIIGSVFLALSLIFHLDILYYQSSFILGLLLYDFFYLKKMRPNINRKLLVIIMIVLFIATNVFIKFEYNHLSDLAATILFTVSMYYLLYAKFKIMPLFNRLADQSYSLYLFHLPILMLYFSFLSILYEKGVFYSRVPYYSGVIIAILINIPLYYLSEYQSLKIISQIKNKKKISTPLSPEKI